MLAKPAAKPLEPLFGVRRHRLVGQPVLEILRQRAHRGDSVRRAVRPTPSNKWPPAAGASSGRASAAARSRPSRTFSMISGTFLPRKGTCPVNNS